MTKRTSNVIKSALGGLAILALAGCDNPNKNMITYSELMKKYAASPTREVVASSGRTQDGLTADTTKGVPTGIRRYQFMIENGTSTDEIEAGKTYKVHSFTNSARIDYDNF